MVRVENGGEKARKITQVPYFRLRHVSNGCLNFNRWFEKQVEVHNVGDARVMATLGRSPHNSVPELREANALNHPSESGRRFRPADLRCGECGVSLTETAPNVSGPELLRLYGAGAL